MNHTDSRPVTIACAANGRYALPLAVMLRSVQANLDPSCSLAVFIVDDGLTADDRQRVLASLLPGPAVHWVRPQRSRFAELPLWGRMPVTTYDKISLPRLLLPGEEKVIWLDCDLLVLGDIARLWDEELGGFHALAARDTLVARLGGRFGVAGWRALGLDREAPYFNAGVMVVNLALWRRDDIAGRALDYLHRFRRRVYFWDQEGLNAVLAGKWRELDAGWNRNPRQAGAPRGRDRPPVDARDDSAWILHFCGNVKPWRDDGASPYQELYYRYLDLTAWRGWRPERDWRSVTLAWYASSSLRRLLAPLEQWNLRLHRRVTAQHATEGRPEAHE